MGHFDRHFMSQIPSESFKLGHIKRINPKFATKKLVLPYLCLSLFSVCVYVCAFHVLDLDLVSE